MIIPDNGKVVIIDDKIEQVKELMMALSKNRIPFSYFQDESGEDLPEEGNHLKSVRLIFLDIVLDTGIDQSEKSVVSNALSRLDRIVGENNGPYFIFLWSTKYEKYGEKLKEEINTKPLFVNRRPIDFIVLKKEELQKKGFEAIIEALDNEIKKFDSLNAFFYWESIINDSAGEITNELISLTNNPVEWNKNTKNILYRLSSAYWGKNIKNISPEESNRKVLGAYSTLNQVLADKIDLNTHTSYDKILDNILELEGENNPMLFAKINEKIHVDNNPQKNVDVPGSIIFCIDELNKEKENKIEELENKINQKKQRHNISPFENIDLILQNMQKGAKKTIDVIEVNIREKNKALNMIVSESIGKRKDGKDLSAGSRKRILKDSLYIELNITPKCDFAQEKVRYHRFLPGALVLEDYRSKINKNADFNYVSDFKIHFNGKLYFFLFDFRHFYSLKKLPEGYSPRFRIKDSFLNELQVKLSGHISRLGLLYMD